MANALTLLALVLYLTTVAGWTYTEYLTIVTTVGFDFHTTTEAVTVSPTGSVSPTKTNITTAQTTVNFSGYAYFNITVTDLYLGPSASVCTPENYQFTCRASTTATTPTDTISTRVWAAVTLSNPSTCTRTSFTYTTSSVSILQNLGNQVQFPGIFNQAADTGSSGEGLFVTTYISTLSVDLGGQPITATRCDIWLKNGALASIEPDQNERGYLAQCVDPRRYICSSRLNTLGDCGTDWIGTYPVTSRAAPSAGTSTPTTTGGGGGPTPSSTNTAGGVVGGRDRPRGGLMLAAMTVTACIYVLLC